MTKHDLLVAVAQAIAGAGGCCRLPVGDDCAVAVMDSAGQIVRMDTPCDCLTDEDFDRARAALDAVRRHQPARGKVLVVNRHIVQRNRKTGEREPPLALKPSKSGKTIARLSEWTSPGRVRLVYDPDKPLPCGASVYLECLPDEEPPKA